MRKFIILLCCIVVLASSAVIGSAVEYPGPDKYYSVLPFDTIAFNDTVVPFPFNVANEETDRPLIEYDDLFSFEGYLYYDSVNGQHVGDLTFRAPANTITLTLSNKLILHESLLRAVFWCMDPSSLNFGQVRITGGYFDVVGAENNGTFSVGTAYHSIDIVDSAISTGKFIGDLIYNEIANNGYDNTLVYIDKLVVEIDLLQLNPSTPYVQMCSVFRRNPPQFSMYVLQENVRFDVPETDIPVGEADLSDFLINTVEGFLGWEILPGISFSNILYIFVIVALLLWFITLLI